MREHSELARQVVHVGVGAFALLLPFIGWRWAALAAATALAFNVLVLPRIAGRVLFRPGELLPRALPGIVLYPASVLLLIVVFRERLDITAAAWAILAFGDGAATIVGRAAGARGGRWPWNPDKSYAGSAAFFVVGAASATALAWWASQAVPASAAWFLWSAPAVAALAAMFVETMPVKLDDNVSVPLSAALVLWAMSLMDPPSWPITAGAMQQRWLGAVLVNAGVAAASWRAGAVSRSGVVAGFVVGVLVWLAGGAGAWLVLFASFALAAVTSRLGLARKRALGIAQERGGRRGAGNVIANCGLAAGAILVARLGAHDTAATLIFAAALIAGASDTVASEIGKAWGGATWSPMARARVPAGAIGGMSVAGTTGGVVAATLLAWVAVAAGLVAWPAIWVLALSALIAMTAESVLGATLEPEGIVNNDLLNFLNTAIGAMAAALLWRVVP